MKKIISKLALFRRVSTPERFNTYALSRIGAALSFFAPGFTSGARSEFLASTLSPGSSSKCHPTEDQPNPTLTLVPPARTYTFGLTRPQIIRFLSTVPWRCEVTNISQGPRSPILFPNGGTETIQQPNICSIHGFGAQFCRFCPPTSPTARPRFISWAFT